MSIAILIALGSLVIAAACSGWAIAAHRSFKKLEVVTEDALQSLRRWRSVAYLWRTMCSTGDWQVAMKAYDLSMADSLKMLSFSPDCNRDKELEDSESSTATIAPIHHGFLQ